jgi:hypothetical protein
MRRAVASSVIMVVLAAAILSIAVIASTRASDETTELLKLLPNGLPDISEIQTGPATKAQIAAQMKKDGLSLNLFNQVHVRVCHATRNHFTRRSFFLREYLCRARFCRRMFMFCRTFILQLTLVSVAPSSQANKFGCARRQAHPSPGQGRTGNAKGDDGERRT